MTSADSDWLSPQSQALARALAPQAYVDPALAGIERSEVFERGWQLVAHAAQLAGAGDHVVAEIAGVPLLLVRGDDGVLRALHNVCRHRAGPLAACDGRGARSLVCRYHGWTYALDGRLRGAPGMEGAAAFDAAAIRLPEAEVAEWAGLVFVALAPLEPFARLVEGIEARLAHAGHALAGYRFDTRIAYTLECNWKIYVDNYLEGYHLPRVHPGLARLLDYRSYRTELAPASVLQWSPLDAAAGPYGSGEALYWWLWPNTMLNVLPGRLQTNRVIPLGPARCRVEFDYFHPDATDAATRAADRAFADRVQAEDIAICEAVQRGLAAGSYRPGPLSPAREAGLWAFHELLRAAYRRGLAA